MIRAFLLLAVLLSVSSVFGVDYYVSPSGDDANPGSLAAPFRTVNRGLTVMQNGDTLYIREGTYRLPDERDGSYTFNKAGASPTNFATIQNYPGERAVLLGSKATPLGAWEQYNESVWRLDASFMNRGPTGMFLGSRRIHHQHIFYNGVRSHPDVVSLTAGSWTLAMDNGTRCSEAGNPAGCFIYYWPVPGENPNENSYELAQQAFLYQRTNYLVVRGLEFYYTQSSPIFSEYASYLLFENNIFAHNSNGNDNAYGLRIWFSQGSVVRNNTFFDSLYWGGVVNSHAVVFMNTVQGVPNIVEYNTIRNPGGMAVSTKNGVSDLIVRYNYISDTSEAIVTSSRRCEGSTCYPGGNWSIYGNIIEDGGTGVVLTAYGGTNIPRDGNKIYNNVFVNLARGIDLPYSTYTEYPDAFANNIFVTTTNGVFLNNGGSGTNREIVDFLPLFSSTNNLFYDATREYCIRRNWGGSSSSCVATSLATMQTTYGVEQSSFVANPLFAETVTYSLLSSSPAIGAANASWWNSDLADIGRFPNARNETIEQPPPTEGICEAAGSGRCFYIDPNGDDAAAGTFAQPLRSPQVAVIQAQPGDVIYLRGGTYTTSHQYPSRVTGWDSGSIISNWITIMNTVWPSWATQQDPRATAYTVQSGTSVLPILISAYPGEVPVLQQSPDGRPAVFIADKTNWIIQGIVIDGRNIDMVGVNQNITIRDSTVRNHWQNGGENVGLIRINRADQGGANNIYIINNTLTDLYDSACAGCSRWDQTGDTIHFGAVATLSCEPYLGYNCGGTKAIHIINNTIRNVPSAFFFKNAAEGPILISGNTIINAQAMGPWITANMQLYNNLFVNVTRSARYGEHLGADTRIYERTGQNFTAERNTFINSNGLVVFEVNGSGHRIRNNIFFGSTQQAGNANWDSDAFYQRGMGLMLPDSGNADFTQSQLGINNIFNENCYISSSSDVLIARRWRNTEGGNADIQNFNITRVRSVYGHELQSHVVVSSNAGAVFQNPLTLDYGVRADGPAASCVSWGYLSGASTPIYPVQRVGDLNGDGVVDIQDVIRIVENFRRRGNYDEGADINGDGVVNIFDMVLLTRNWG